MRPVNPKLVAQQRRGFWRTIQKWSTPDLHSSIIRYRMEALIAPGPGAVTFYASRIRCLNREIRARAARTTRAIQAQPKH
jgi:hypothetical protein